MDGLTIMRGFFSPKFFLNKTSFVFFLTIDNKHTRVEGNTEWAYYYSRARWIDDIYIRSLHEQSV